MMHPAKLTIEYPEDSICYENLMIVGQEQSMNYLTVKFFKKPMERKMNSVKRSVKRKKEYPDPEDVRMKIQIHFTEKELVEYALDKYARIMGQCDEAIDDNTFRVLKDSKMTKTEVTHLTGDHDKVLCVSFVRKIIE